MTGAILCILDGITHPGFTVPTALKPYLRGCFDTTPSGLPTESLTCILNLLGVPHEVIASTGRGWLEAVGQGIAVREDDLLLRTTWVRVDGAGRVCAYAVPDDPPAIDGFYPLGGYKGLLVYPHMAHLLQVVRTHPPYKQLGAALSDCLPSGLPPLPQPLAEQGLYLLPWGQSRQGRLPKLPDVAFVGGTALVRGIAVAMGMQLYENHRFTGDVDTDLAAKTEKALMLARGGKRVLLHINGADEAAHRRDSAEKSAFTARLVSDCALPLLLGGVPVIVTSDHGTDAATGCHSELPQPFYSNLELNGKIPAARAVSLLTGVKFEK